MLGEAYRKKTMKKQTLKNYLLLSLVLISQLHVLFRDLEYRVDWFICIDYTRRIDYAVMYLFKYLTEFILAYCLLFPNGISKDAKVFIFLMCAWDLIHYFTFSSMGFELEKMAICGLSFVCYKIWGR